MKPVPLEAKQSLQKAKQSAAQTYYGSNNAKFKRYVKPMLAKLHGQPFSDRGWVFEIKWDGYRAVSEIDPKTIKLYSRNGLSFAEDYPVIYDELRKIRERAILDGEIVVMDVEGKPKFELLQQYTQDKSLPICYFVFDCLSINGKSIEDKPLVERKRLLQELLPESDVVRYCDHVAERGQEFFNLIQKQGLEGMMAKRAASTYVEGKRASDWLKVKNVITGEAIIAGYTEARGSRKHFGALVLGIYKKGKLTYIGHTGTGFSDKGLEDLFERMQALKINDSPFDVKVPVNAQVTWIRPELVCNIKYTEETSRGHRRHPVYLGLRIDKSAKDVEEEVSSDNNRVEYLETKSHKKMESQKSISGKLELSHLDKIFWPQEGYTKGDVIEYYNMVYPHIIKYMKDRPESLFRTPNGIDEKGFFQKDAGLNAPDWVKYHSLYSESAGKEINYIICNNRPTLLYLANLGCIEMNPWNSRLKNLDNPDYLVLDLDPSQNNTFDQTIELANVIREILDRAGAPSFPKTSGASGIHIYVPLGAKYTYDQAKDFAHTIAVMANELLPDFTTLERSLSKRGKGHIYVDYLQNRKGQTLACAYSLRPRPGGTVSTPLEWREVKKGLHPSDFTFKNIASRIKIKGDIFSPVLLKGIDMKKCLKRLSE